MRARLGVPLLGLAFVALGSWPSCVRPTEERAERDLEIGKVEIDGTRFEVGGGLAAVRAAKSGALSLWSSAPVYTIQVTNDGGESGSWTLDVDNCMPDASLGVESGEATVVDLEPELGTRKRWLLTVAGGASATLRLGPADATSLAPWRFAVMSDVQEAIDEVQDIYAKVNATPNVSFLLGAGDLTERGTVEELERFQLELRGLNVPYYTTLGNHELGAGTAETPYQDWFGRASFRFGYRGVTFSMLDSAGASIDPMVYDWLDEWLAGARDQVHVVAMHIPPVDPIGVRNGSFASRAEAAKLLARLAKGKVDLTLYGHIHSHYEFDNAGIPARISGGGGAIPEKFDGIGRHFLVVDVDPLTGIKDVSVVRVDD